VTAPVVRLDADWELWAIENLMAGAPRREIVAALVEEGISPANAEDAVRALLARDLVRTTRRRLVRGRRSEQALRLHHHLRGPLVVDDVDDEAPEAFFKDRWQPGRPVRFLSAFKTMRAVADWSLRRVADELGAVEVDVNTRREDAEGPSSIEHHADTMPLGAFIDDCLQGRGNDRYIVSKNGLLQRPDLQPLVDAIDPLPAVLDGTALPRGASLWIGPAGTFTHPHFDPHHAFLVMLEGRKRVRLAAPTSRSSSRGWTAISPGGRSPTPRGTRCRRSIVRGSPRSCSNPDKACSFRWGCGTRSRRSTRR
jgi:hypothetical protein